MERQLTYFVNCCVKRGYIEEEKAPWLEYALQKRLVMIVVGIPFFVTGIWISSFWQAIVFLTSFYFLRQRTSGAHCSNMYYCLACSLLLEILFLGVLPEIASRSLLDFLVLISAGIILRKAPFPCPYLNMNTQELKACAIGSKVRICILLTAYLISHFFDEDDILRGIGCGIVMAAFLLAIAYINPKENKL